MLVTGFGYLLAIIKPKTCGSTIKRNHTDIVLPVKINTSGNKNVKCQNWGGGKSEIRIYKTVKT